jgi:hypothetical protein
MRYFVLLFLVLGTPISAQAGAKQEYHRLHDEMGNLAARGAWKGVDRTYASMVELEEKGLIELTYADHLLGATAAKTLGDVNRTWEAGTRANTADPMGMEAQEMLAVIFANFGQVQLKVKKNLDREPTLEAKDLGFNPEQLRVVQAAQQALLETRSYAGLLPLGRYVLAGQQNFGIDGGAPISVTAKKEPTYLVPTGDY